MVLKVRDALGVTQDIDLDGKPTQVRDSAGDLFSPDSLPSVLGYDADGNVATITKTDGEDTWVKTLTWEADPVNGGYRSTGSSAWVKS